MRSATCWRSTSTRRPCCPTDEVSYGFDNIAGVLKLSPLLTERYLNAAQKVARLALGTPGAAQRRSVPRPRPARSGCAPRGHAAGHARRHAHRLLRRHGTASTTSRRASGAASIPTSRTSSASRTSKISIDGERVHMFTLPATPDEDLNIERQVFQAPGTERAASPQR